MKYSILLSSLFIFLLSSCGNEESKGNAESPETNQIEESNDWETIAINEGGFKLSMKIPSQEVARTKSEIIYNEDFGELEIGVGKMFNLLLFEDESQIEMVKNEIKSHPFYKVELSVENDSTLLYRYYTEEGAKEQWHIYVERKYNSSILMIRSNETMEFSEFESKKMLESALSIKPGN